MARCAHATCAQPVAAAVTVAIAYVDATAAAIVDTDAMSQVKNKLRRVASARLLRALPDYAQQIIFARHSFFCSPLSGFFSSLAR